MTNGTVHLEDVTRAARWGAGLAIAGSLLALAALLAAGLAPAIAAVPALAVLALGLASGGFGLVARVTMPAPRLRRQPSAASGGDVTPLRVPLAR